MDQDLLILLMKDSQNVGVQHVCQCLNNLLQVRLHRTRNLFGHLPNGPATVIANLDLVEVFKLVNVKA